MEKGKYLDGKENGEWTEILVNPKDVFNLWEKNERPSISTTVYVNGKRVFPDEIEIKKHINIVKMKIVEHVFYLMKQHFYMVKKWNI